MLLRQRGMRKWLPDLLVLLILLAIVLGFAIPNLRIEYHRSRQKRTSADMRTIATAWEARATDTNSYNVGDSPNVSHGDLRRALSPTYSRQLPALDGWGNPFRFSTSAPNGDGQYANYTIVSFGRDGKHDPGVYAQRAILKFDNDIVYSVGQFVQYPEGS